jgi:hypothetical protein
MQVEFQDLMSRGGARGVSNLFSEIGILNPWPRTKLMQN